VSVPPVPPQERLAGAGFASGSHRSMIAYPGRGGEKLPGFAAWSLWEEPAPQPAARSERLSPGALSSPISPAGTGRLKW